MFVPEINEVKGRLEEMAKSGKIEAWELPYENLLTRLTAAIFFIEPAKEEELQAVWGELANHENFSFRENYEKKLSQMKYRVTFSIEEKEKNQQKETMVEESANV